MQKSATPYLTALCGNLGCCPKDRHLRKQKAVNESFEDGLDILKLVETNSNLRYLLKVLLTKPARLLLKHHRNSVLPLSMPPPSADSDQTEDSDEQELPNTPQAIYELLKNFQPETAIEKNLLRCVLPSVETKAVTSELHEENDSRTAQLSYAS